MKRLTIADIHLSAYGNDSIKDGLPQRLSDIMASMEQVSAFAVKNNIKFIDILGDINNDKDIFYTKPFILFKQWMQRYQEIIFTLLSGNHDMDTAGDEQVSSIEGFRGIQNVEIITEKWRDEELGISWVPYSKNIVDDVRGDDAAPILLSHFGVSEAQLSSGISIIADIKARDLAKYKLVLLGHYHKPQNIGNTHYVGDPFQSGWGEKNEEKRFMIYDTDTLETDSIPLVGYTQHIELTINTLEEAKSVFEEEAEMKALGHKVRLKNLTNKEIVNEGSHIITKIEKDITNRGVSLDMTTEEKLEKYAEIQEVEDKEKYLNIGKQLCNLDELQELKLPLSGTVSKPDVKKIPKVQSTGCESKEIPKSVAGLFELDL